MQENLSKAYSYAEWLFHSLVNIASEESDINRYWRALRVRHSHHQIGTCKNKYKNYR